MSVLGGMLIDGDAVARAVELVDDSMFYREAHRRLYRAMARMFERGEVLDVITVSEELKRAGDLDSAGGLEYLASLLDAVPTAANIEYHARIVREKALLRRLIDAAQSDLDEGRAFLRKGRVVCATCDTTMSGNPGEAPVAGMDFDHVPIVAR